MGERNLVDKPEGKNHLDDLGIDGKITLQCILKKQDGKVWVGFIWLSTEASDRLFRIQQ
jgi:hypothetical protein